MSSLAIAAKAFSKLLNELLHMGSEVLLLQLVAIDILAINLNAQHLGKRAQFVGLILVTTLALLSGDVNEPRVDHPTNDPRPIFKWTRQTFRLTIHIRTFR